MITAKKVLEKTIGSEEIRYYTQKRDAEYILKLIPLIESRILSEADEGNTNVLFF